ncbi:MAG: DUF222 domain-containing protein [Acidimicrobiales bacterium]|nr:DUF222 domain-containing protein [Acidimicrobiales bacterium]
MDVTTTPRPTDPGWQALARGTDDEWADVAGIWNASAGRLVDLAIVALAEGHHIGPGLHTIGQFLCWKTGMSAHTAAGVVRLAKRADELPCLLGALRAGEISLDQAAVVARHIHPDYDRSATELAKSASVAQLRKVMPHYRGGAAADPLPRRPSASIGRNDDDQGILFARLDAADADVVERGLEAMRDDLLRQRRADATAAGEDPGRVDLPSWAEALVAMADAALAQGQATHPTSDRYLVTYHLSQTASGAVTLTDHRGRTLPDADRRQLLCDHRFQVLHHGEDGTPLSVGRTTHDIGRKLRRAILFRDGHACAVPGCSTTLGLQIHHIWHWEDGGPTDTANLLTLCGRHHRAHHKGLLEITGNADLPAGTPGAVVIATPEHQPIRPGPCPRPVIGAETARTLHRLRRELTHRTRSRRRHPRAATPSGEPLRLRDVHLTPHPPPMRT